MKLKKFIENTVRGYLNEITASENPSDYTGQHSAPSKDENDPMYNVENMFPDMYTDKALRYYGGYGLDDSYVINQIKSVYNKPNKSVTIYRAVPDINKDLDKKIKDLQNLLQYKFKFNFFPVVNKLRDSIEDKIKKENPNIGYDELQQELINEIYKTIEDLKNKKQKTIKINNGDWVTTSLMYAKQHGKSSLDDSYKIVKKTVKASQLYTDGNSIFEWGYNI
jgi:hypothetical protein